MGHYGAVLKILVVQAFHGEDRQQPIDLHHDNAESQHTWVIDGSTSWRDSTSR